MSSGTSLLLFLVGLHGLCHYSDELMLPVMKSLFFHGAVAS